MGSFSLSKVISSDAVYRKTLWYDLIDLLIQWVEILGIAAIFGFLIYGVAHYGIKACRAHYLLFGGALAFKYAAAIIATWVVGGSIDLTDNYSSYLVAILLELTECIFAVFLAHRLTAHCKDASDAKCRAARTLGAEITPDEPFVPFRTWLSRTNPVQRSAFWGMVLVLAARSLAYVMQEIAFAIFAGFSARDLPVTLVYWLLLIMLPSALGYLLALLCMRLADREQRKE